MASLADLQARLDSFDRKKSRLHKAAASVDRRNQSALNVLISAIRPSEKK